MLYAGLHTYSGKERLQHICKLNISLRHYSLLWTINGAMIVCAQPLVSMLIRWMKRSLKQQIMIGIFILRRHSLC